LEIWKIEINSFYYWKLENWVKKGNKGKSLKKKGQVKEGLNKGLLWLAEFVAIFTLKLLGWGLWFGQSKL